MKTALLIPHRNDRPAFLDHLKYMISQQTIQPDIVLFVDYEPESPEKDITQRYRRGYDQLRYQNIDAILFMEVDDYYHPTYIETMVTEWQKHGSPDLFGTSYTYYYHIGIRKCFRMSHAQRSSAMSTLIRPDLSIKWCPDSEPYTDSHLWMVSGLKGVVFTPKQHICVGIKHDSGVLTGGNMHIDRLHRYDVHGFSDPECEWLGNIVDKKSLDFYKNFKSR